MMNVDNAWFITKLHGLAGLTTELRICRRSNWDSKSFFSGKLNKLGFTFDVADHSQYRSNFVVMRSKSPHSVGIHFSCYHIRGLWMNERGLCMNIYSFIWKWAETSFRRISLCFCTWKLNKNWVKENLEW